MLDYRRNALPFSYKIGNQNYFDNEKGITNAFSIIIK